MNEANESQLDYMIFAPTTDPKRLIMYSNMGSTGPMSPPVIGSAFLINP